MATLLSNLGNLLFNNRKMLQDTSPDKEEEGEEHKIYIDERILSKNYFFINNDNGTAAKFDTVYEINGEIFREENHNDNDSYIEFEVQLNDWNDDVTDVEETETVNIYFEIISYQEINEGVIINSYIFLTLNQWNTLIVGENYKFCFVCDDVVESLEHIKMVAHIENLERSKPLKKFDLAITRLIGESYHCAVCNVIFNISNEKDHFNSESHKDKMENARNRTLELIENGNYVNDYESNEASDDDDSSNDIELNNENNGNNENKGNNDTDLNNGNNAKSISYAAMVKKPNPTPKYIIFTVGDITYNISYDNWHMIIYPRTNQFYCMACKAFGPISSKTAHCSHINHTIKLSYCHFVEKYHQYLIRQMFLDFKFYHCILCNKVILISEVDDHIINVHDKKFVNTDITEAEKNNKIQNKFDGRYMNNGNARNRNNDVSRNTNNDVSNKFNKMNYYKINISRELLEINNESPGLYNDIVLYQFFCKIRISFGAYNIILKSMQGLFCGVCNIVTNEEAMKYHLIDFNHVERLRILPFEAYFGVNLIRLVNNRIHCAICNVFIDNLLKAISHISCKPHRALLNQSLKGPDATSVNPADSTNQKGQIDSNQFKDQPKMNYMQENKIESNEHSESLDDSIESIENYEHEFLYLHFKNKHIKVTFNAYHSLVAIGDGTRYCFVCSTLIIGCSKMHIHSRAHTIALKKCKFLDKFDKHLLRQVYLLYHCCTCNVVFSKKYLNKHLSWPIQEDKTNKTKRKYDLNSGIKFLRVETQKEEIFLNVQESKMEIIGSIDIKPKSNHVEIKKTNKIIILDSNVFKLSWDSWQGILNKKNGYFCILCDKDLKNFELNYHITEEWHANALENTFDKDYFPNLIRKVTDTTVHCLTCNQVMPYKGYYILEHVNCKKHKFTYNSIRDYSATVKSYSDCNDNVLYLSN